MPRRPPRILFACYGGGHVNALLPVIRKLASVPSEAELRVLGLTTARDVLRSAGIPAVGFREFLDPESSDWDRKALSLGQKLLGQTAADPRVAREESMAYLGASHLELIESLGEDEAARLYEAKGRAAYLPLRMLERIIRKSAPDIVVATSSPRAEKASILVAGRLGIPSLCLLDLLALVDMRGWIGHPDFGDRLCVISEAVRQIAIEHGRRPEQVVVTGNPAFEALAPNPDRSRLAARYRDEMGFGKRKVFLWARSFMKHELELAAELNSELARIFAKRPDWQLLVRAHPNETLAPQPKSWMVSAREDSLPVVIAASDVILTTASTVGYEAAILGKPVVTTDYFPTVPDTPFSKMGISLGAATLEELESRLEDAADGRFVPSPLPNPADATDAVIREILALQKR